MGESAEREWSTLVTTAVLGTDRRPLPAAAPGWESPVATDDAAVELLNRAAAVATARRSGMRPAAPPLPIEPAPFDERPMCPAAAAAQLDRMLRGQHDILLPEWFALCRKGDFQLPLHLLPALLLRGRRNPAFDAAVRAVAGQRAAWLADAMPELRIKVRPTPLASGADPFLAPAPPIDSGAVVSAIVGTFVDRTATWAAVGQIRLAVAGLDPAWLPALILELNRAPFHAVTERTRVDLLGVAQLRSEMIATLPSATPDHSAKRSIP